MAALVGACLSRSAKTASALAVCHVDAPHNVGCVVCKGMATARIRSFSTRSDVLWVRTRSELALWHMPPLGFRV